MAASTPHFRARRSTLAVLAACALVACSLEAPQTRTARTAARLPLRVYDTSPEGVRMVTLPRATPGVVRLALYIDAGSRDAALPEAATLSAWLAAENGDAAKNPEAATKPDHTAIEATIFPDVTELALTCTSEDVPAGIGLLAHALSTRSPNPQALSRARLRLRDGQRRALAHSPHEGADRLALHALLGAAADGFFPLGKPDGDLAAAGDAVPQFLSDHYGPKRTLLVAAGDVEPLHVREAVGVHFASAPPAGLPRNAREIVPTGHDAKLEVAFDDRAALSFALAGPTVGGMRDVVSQLSAALSGGEPRVEVAGNVFAVRTGALALLRITSSDAELALDRATRELARLQLEPNVPVTAPVHDDSLIASCRELGWELGAEGPATVQTFRFAAGLALAAGSDGGPAASAELQETSKRRSEHAQSTWQRALAQAEPATHGDSDEYIATVTLDNGAHVDVQFTHGDAVAVAIRVGLGAEQDSPLSHGQAALLATATTMSCAGMGPDLLHDRFERIGATLEARVDGESYGVLLRVPQAHFEEAIDLALRCVRAPSRSPRELVEAGVRLQQRLRASSAAALAFRARAANLVSPRAPGAFAPWGDPERIANIDARELEQAWRAAQQGERWSVGIVGQVPVKRTVSLTARRLADLASSAPKPAPWSEPAAVLPSELPHSREAVGVKLMAVWTARGAFDHPLGARLYARALAALLAAVPGVEVLWHDADVYRQTAFAALALRLRPDLAPSFPALLVGAARSIDDRWLERALEPAVAEARQGENAAQAQLATRAERIARQRVGASFGQPRLDSARQLVQALRDSRPGFAPAP